MEKEPELYMQKISSIPSWNNLFHRCQAGVSRSAAWHTRPLCQDALSSLLFSSLLFSSHLSLSLYAPRFVGIYDR